MRDFLSQNTEFYSKLLNLIDFSKRQEGVLIYRIVRDKLVTSFGKLMKVKIENYIAN